VPQLPLLLHPPGVPESPLEQLVHPISSLQIIYQSVPKSL